MGILTYVRTRSSSRNASVARIARTLLAHQGRRQQDLAAHLGMDSGSMSLRFKGDRKWTLDDLDGMAEFFNVSVTVFFEDPETIVRNRWSLTRVAPGLAFSA